MGLNGMGISSDHSDYGSGSSMNSLQSTSWGSQELHRFQSQLLSPPKPRTKAASFNDLVNGRCTIEDVMQEFRMNGTDSPYNPDDDQYWTRAAEMSSGMSPANGYKRQMSWPEPERTPPQRLQRPVSVSFPVTPAPSMLSEVPELPSLPPPPCALTAEQRRVLSSLPDAAVLTLLREMRRRSRRQPDECRFCKNNGERESFYRSHVLKEASGRVECPVLRAFVCKRCGASGDTAHTIKYCPLSTGEERMKSAAMMRSVRLSSGRRRLPSPRDSYVVFGETPGAVLADGDAYARLATQDGDAYARLATQYNDAYARLATQDGDAYARLATQDGDAYTRLYTQASYSPPAPLEPQWAALEQKLML